MTNTQKKAKAFLKYVNEHLDQRFFQALLNFTKLPYILISDRPPSKCCGNGCGDVNCEHCRAKLEDTFYLED